MTKRQAAERLLTLAHVIRGSLDDEGGEMWADECELLAYELAGLLPRDVEVKAVSGG